MHQGAFKKGQMRQEELNSLLPIKVGFFNEWLQHAKNLYSRNDISSVKNSNL